MDLYTQVLLSALAVLLVVFLGMILLQLVGYSLSLIASEAEAPRRAGVTQTLAGVALLAFGVGTVVLQDYLQRTLGTSTMVVSLGLFATGLYTVAEGVGILLWRRARGGVVMLIWAMLGGIVWLAF